MLIINGRPQRNTSEGQNVFLVHHIFISPGQTEIHSKPYIMYRHQEWQNLLPHVNQNSVIIYYEIGQQSDIGIYYF
jgi:hypothetical protein